MALFAMAALVVTAAPAYAYVGPGIALGALGAGFGVLMTGTSAVFYLSVLWCRRLWRRLTGQAQPPDETQTVHRDS